MVKTFVTGKGNSIQLGREIGTGGEGVVYEVISDKDQVAKLYNNNHLPDNKKQAKLRYMVSTINEQLQKYATWPQDTLHHYSNGPIIGFLMPKVIKHDEIHKLYSPARRRQDYPEVAWDFLLFVARNTAAAFNTIHSHGHIIGDVNQKNIMVNKDSKVILIDCDSFQINANGEIHLCKVGTPDFMPSELQGLSSLDTIQRNFNHDNFGLALIIFHLLFGGRHPYSGVPLRPDVGETLESNIKAFRFAYAKDSKQRYIMPPPNSIPLSIVPESIMTMFEASFTEIGIVSGRPTAHQWVSAFDSLRKQLRRCSLNTMHIFPNQLYNCPWCDLETKKVFYFVDIGLKKCGVVYGFILNKVWDNINAIHPPEIINIPDISKIVVKPVKLPRNVVKPGLILFLKIIVTIINIILCIKFPVLIVFALVIFGLPIYWVDLIGKKGREKEFEKREKQLNEAEKDYTNIKNCILNDTGYDNFIIRKNELESLLQEYIKLPDKEKNDIKSLNENAENRQKEKFLERFYIDTAYISGVGLARKATLRSFGIETAADIEWNKVYSIHGFGYSLTNAIVKWKKRCELKFVFDPKNAVTEADIIKVKKGISSRKYFIELMLSKGANELKMIRQDIETKVNNLYPSLNDKAKKYAQALADFKLIK